MILTSFERVGENKLNVPSVKMKIKVFSLALSPLLILVGFFREDCFDAFSPIHIALSSEGVGGHFPLCFKLFLGSAKVFLCTIVFHLPVGRERRDLRDH